MHDIHPGARPMTTRARRTALALIACGAALAWTAPAAAQASETYPAGTLAGIGGCTLSVTQPGLVNRNDVERAASAAYPATLRGYARPRVSALLEIRVLADGTVDTSSWFVKESDYPEFGEAARAVLPAMRFEPATVGGAAVPAWIRHRLTFQDPTRTPPDEGVYSVSEPLTEMPVLQNAAELAAEIHRDGPPAAALVQLRVDRNGAVTASSIAVLMATDSAIEEPVRAIARRMRFTPGKLMDQPAPGVVAIPVHFGCMAPGGAS